MGKSKTKKPAAVTRKPASKVVAAAASAQTVSGSRKLKKRQYKSFRLSKRIKHIGPTLPSAWVLTRHSWRVFWDNKKTLWGILLVYGLLQIVFVQGVLKTDFSQVSDATKELFGNQWHGLAGGLTSLTYLFSSIGQTSSSESALYQSTLIIITSLAFIWALRQLVAQHATGIKDAFYRGMYPLVPFLLVIVVISLQLIPLLIGAWLYSTVAANGIAVSGVEYAFWLVVFGLFALLTAYMVCSSIFALYIVTLPHMTPMKALRSARQLVLHRRWTVARKLLFLAFWLMVVMAVIMVPTIMVATPVVPAVFYILNVIMLGFAHTYIYTLYRELLNE